MADYKVTLIKTAADIVTRTAAVIAFAVLGIFSPFGAGIGAAVAGILMVDGLIKAQEQYGRNLEANQQRA